MIENSLIILLALSIASLFILLPLKLSGAIDRFWNLRRINKSLKSFSSSEYSYLLDAQPNPFQWVNEISERPFENMKDIKFGFDPAIHSSSQVVHYQMARNYHRNLVKKEYPKRQGLNLRNPNHLLSETPLCDAVLRKYGYNPDRTTAFDFNLGDLYYEVSAKSSKNLEEIREKLASADLQNILKGDFAFISERPKLSMLSHDHPSLKNK